MIRLSGKILCILKMDDVKLCRLCAQKKEAFIGIYDDEGHKLRIELKIIKCLQIDMYPEDPLPKMVCLECCTKLDQSFHFLECSHLAQMSLHQLFPVAENSCHSSELKEESLVELLPLPAAQDHELVQEHLNQVADDMSEKMEEACMEEEIEEEGEEEEEVEEEEEEGDRLLLDSLEVIEGVVEIANDENEPARALKRKAAARRQKKASELSEQEIELLMAADKQWQCYPWTCAECSLAMGSVEELRAHWRLAHNQDARYACAHCAKVVGPFAAFFTHIKRHRNLLKYRCESCGKGFSNKRVLESHAGTHTDARPYVCERCGKAFRQQSALYVHARCHLPDDVKNKYLCDQCNKRFSTRPNLMTHKRIHAGVRDFTCDQCGKSFVQKGNLDAHLVTHSLDKPFACHLCAKRFRTAMQLRKHGSVHTGARPHQCEVCGRSFRERGTLREHTRIHTGAMPFACEYCGKTFRFKGILTTHRRQHTGERPYSCVECQHHFTNWPNYNKHMKRRHGINTSRQAKGPAPAPPPPLPPPQPTADASAAAPPPLYEEFAAPPAFHQPLAAAYAAPHPHAHPHTAPSLQQFFTFTQHLDPTLDLMHR